VVVADPNAEVVLDPNEKAEGVVVAPKDDVEVLFDPNAVGADVEEPLFLYSNHLKLSILKYLCWSIAQMCK